jgi:hypothetical protein
MAILGRRLGRQLWVESRHCGSLATPAILRLMQPPLVLLLFSTFAGAASTAGGASQCVPTLPGWVRPYEKTGLQLRPNTVTLRGRDLRWNGTIVDERRLPELLRSAAKLSPLPPLVLKSDYQDCALAHRIERMIKASYPCSDGRCSQLTSP